VIEGPSLARRAIRYLAVVQLFTFLIAWIVTIGLGLAGIGIFNKSIDELATYRVTKLVIASLVRGDDGLVRIEPIPELRTEILRTPSLQFAAFSADRKQPILGSSQKLVTALSAVIEVSPTHTHFVLPGDPEATPLGQMEPRWTRFGRMHIAVYNQKFRSDDILYAILADTQWLAAYIVGAIVMSAGTAWFAVRQSLTPLSAVIAEVARVDMNSLDQQLPTGGVPKEISPLVIAMNDALARLDASAMRMRRYTANAAHELRTPLAILRARVQNSEDSGAKGILLSEVNRLQAIVEQTLMAARLTEGQVALGEEFDLVETVRKITSSYLHLAIECDRTVEFEAETSLLSRRGNRRVVESIVSNLIDNALKAEPIGGTVVVRVRSGAVVEVIDHGEGIAESDRELIFEPFWRKSEATPGTGLGLAIAKELVEKLQGRIWVEETPGGGATFKLAFPRSMRFYTLKVRSPVQ
jgi:two-component system OmpR family sensor kinase